MSWGVAPEIRSAKDTGLCFLCYKWPWLLTDISYRTQATSSSLKRKDNTSIVCTQGTDVVAPASSCSHHCYSHLTSWLITTMSETKRSRVRWAVSCHASLCLLLLLLTASPSPESSLLFPKSAVYEYGKTWAGVALIAIFWVTPPFVVQQKMWFH